jgi:L-asparaginase / beta-aspartyl-peptidase
MKPNHLLWLLLGLLALSGTGFQAPATHPRFGLVIHGGAGTLARAQFTPEKEAAYHQVLGEVLKKGYQLLESGATAVEVVEQCIWIMEDSPLFNAGRGAVLTYEGLHELDASIMDGRDRQAGAVAGVRTVRHPISAARKVMEASPHVMLSGAGADSFARGQGLEQVENVWFRDATRYEQWKKAKAKLQSNPQGDADPEWERYRKFGTVGVAVLDRHGNLAAGTSTGGMGMKRWGRIGDSPIIGAGTWADNATCAISCTGHGEYFMRYVVAQDIAARMAYKKQSLQKAAEAVILGVLKEKGGEGGMVGIDRQGKVTLCFNSEGMYRGYYVEGGAPWTGIFGE